MAHAISSIEQFLNALGGDVEIAKNYGVSKQCVSMWRTRNHISSGFHLRLWAEAKRKGLDVCPSVFGLNSKEAEGLVSHKSTSFNRVELQQNVVHDIA